MGLDFSKIKTFSAHSRNNLTTLENMLDPQTHTAPPIPDRYAEAFAELVKRIKKARQNGRPVIFSMGAHVIKLGLSKYVAALMDGGIITHLAGNGACSIHDFELAFAGGTAEDVPTAIEDGSFGMWEETGRWMNEAFIMGMQNKKGYGEALACFIDRSPEKFPYKDDCLLYRAHKLGIPCTYHVAIGTDIIHQHPAANFAAIGFTTGQDFKIYCESVSKLDGGVFLNFGSAVIGPEVFLKALSIARNLGCPTFDITTANLDLVELGDFRVKIGYDDQNYYYRPRKNIVNRPTSCGGWGWHFAIDHRVSLPNLFEKIL
ncbi:MAG: hypothetical protein FWE82_00755 [Defluviitaleaceae bacterium]|nr:hypothetical protein [Defluviitaleaceae bacterium]